MRRLLANDQFAKVTMAREENALLTMGDRQHLTVGERLGIIMGNRRDVVALILEKARKTVLSALVQQKSHNPDGVNEHH